MLSLHQAPYPSPAGKDKELVMADIIPISTAESLAKSCHHRRIDSGVDVGPPIGRGAEI